MLKLEQISKYFNKDKIVLDDISFEIQQGELVFLTGHSGSGKTTIFKLIIKEYEPNSGKIFFEETEINHLKKRKIPFLRQKIGVIFQDYRLVPDLSVWENIALPLYIQKKHKQDIVEKVADLLKLVDLDNHDHLFPAELSGGEAQKVTLARALALSPDLILADEPTGNLDNESALKIAKMLEKINNLGTTVIIVTHDLHLLEKIDYNRHLELKNGHLIKDNLLKPPINQSKNKKINFKENKQPQSTQNIKNNNNLKK